MDYLDRYDELENIETSLELLADETSDWDYKSQFLEIIFEVKQEMEELAEKITQEKKAEEREMEKQYIRGVL